MSDSWRSRQSIYEDQELPALQCRVYSRIALQDHDCITKGYCLEFAPGNSFDFGFCREQNVISLLRDVLTVGNTRVLLGSADFLMLPTVPTTHWVKQVRKYNPKKVIMWLANSLELNDEYKDSIPRLKKMGMRFAIRIDAMGDIASNPEILSCIDFLMVDASRYDEFLPIIESLKRQNEKLEIIGFKQENHIINFTKDEIKPFKYVLGMVENSLIEYDNTRPKWQHEMLRLQAQLYSSIYDSKDISLYMQNYPYMSKCMKGLLGSSHLTALTLKLENQLNTANLVPENSTLSSADIRDYIAISIVYNTFMLSEKLVCEQKQIPFDESHLNYEVLVQAIHFAMVVHFFASEVCDDLIAPQAFIAGLLRYTHLYLHDTYDRTFSEFPLDAVSSLYNGGGGQLGSIIRLVLDLFEHKVDEALAEASSNGINLAKEDIFNHISHAFTWTDAALRAMGILKATDGYSL